MVGDNKALTARCSWNGTSSLPAECQNSDYCVGNRGGSHGVCLDKTTSTVVYLNDHTCECDSGFELKLTARVTVYQLPSTMLGHVFSNVIKFEETVIYKCHEQCLQSLFRDG